MMDVYHGSYTKIDKIDLSKGQLNRDFGQGFYVTKFLQGQIEKSVFLKELTYHETTHQICFCTMRVLLCLDHKDKTFALRIADISEKILSTLITDKKSDEETVSDIFYDSNIFVQLSDESSELYKKHWTEIYQMLKNELDL